MAKYFKEFDNKINKRLNTHLSKLNGKKRLSRISVNLDKVFNFGLRKNIRGIVEFREAMSHPVRVQQRVLLRIIRKNRNTMYGRAHNFKKIKSIEDYQKLVPIVDYEDIQQSIEQIKNGKQNILTKDRVIFFATTSGTTKKVKLIPITSERKKILRTELLIWSSFFLRKDRKILDGKMLYFAGPYQEFYTKAGIPCGSISGYLAYKTPWFVKKKMVVPPRIYNIMDFDEKTKKIALYALRSNVTQIGFASPIEAILFFDYLKQNRVSLTEELKRRRTLRAKNLERLKEFRPIDIWPKLRLVNCIKSKFNQLYLDALRQKIGKRNIKIRDPGIYSSEGRISLCIDDSNDISGVPPAHENFFEYWEQKNGECIGEPISLADVKKGKEYLVILTTPEGLYRYNMGDIIRVTGFKKKLPLIEFRNRDNFMNIAGELAHENILIESMQLALKRSSMDVRGFTFLPLILPTKKPRYEVLVELKSDISDAAAKKLLFNIDKSLQENISDYKQMRNEFGRLDLPVLTILKRGSYDSFEKKRVVRGGQPKPIYMSKDSKFKENFEIDRRVE